MAIEDTPFAAFEKASFDEIAFPYRELSVKGSTRYSVHDFPHAAGGEIEKMGRKPYVIIFKAFFHDIPGSLLEREYPGLYPVKLRQLREKFDRELTADLIIPNIGKVKAYATSWSQHIDTSVVSGETVEMEFIEDQEAATLIDSVTEFGTFASMAEANDQLFAAIALAAFREEQTFSIFQAINDAVTAVQGAFGTADAFSRVIEGKIRAVENLCSMADGQLSEMQDPTNHLVVNALKDVWLAARELAEDITESQQKLRIFTVPKKMSIGEVSVLIYGTTERAYELMQINPLDDALSIRASTPIKYLAAA